MSTHEHLYKLYSISVITELLTGSQCKIKKHFPLRARQACVYIYHWNTQCNEFKLSLPMSPALLFSIPLHFCPFLAILFYFSMLVMTYYINIMRNSRFPIQTLKVNFLSWEDDSVSKSICCASRRTWVQIPIIHKKLDVGPCAFNHHAMGNLRQEEYWSLLASSLVPNSVSNIVSNL
jgi:hypothetical protein